jgi:hypothetical protein
MRRLGARLALCASLLILLPASGCVFSYGQLDVLQYGDAFDEAYVYFNRSVRWGYWEKGLPYVAPDDREAFAEAMESLGGFVLTDWDVVVLDMGKGLGSAYVEVQIEGYFEATMARRTVRFGQEWERTDRQGNWQVKPRTEALVAAFATR